MKLVNSLCIGAGHAATGKGASGAVGYLRESDEAREIRNKVFLLNNKKFPIYDCTVDAGTQSSVLVNAVKLANKSKADVDIQIHFNAFKKQAKDGRAKGVEALVYSAGNTKANAVANQLCKEISSKLDIPNRGVKVNKNLYFLKKTSAPAVILEVCFCDDEDDFIAYTQGKGRNVVANAIMNLIK